MLRLSEDKKRLCIVIAILIYLTLTLVHYYETRTQLARIVRYLDRIEDNTGSNFARIIDNNDRLIELKKELLGIDDRKPDPPGTVGVEVID